MRKAFTLIELLVVIAIIAILAAILFPVFAQAKASAKAAATLSNMKQVVLGAQMYAGDFDDTMVLGQSWYTEARINGLQFTKDGIPFNSWRSLVYPYTKNFAIFTDPAAPNIYVGSAFSSHADMASLIYGNIGINHMGMAPMVYNSSTGTQAPIGLSASSISKPAETVYFTEIFNNGVDNPSGDWVWDGNWWWNGMVDAPMCWDTSLPDGSSYQVDGNVFCIWNWGTGVWDALGLDNAHGGQTGGATPRVASKVATSWGDGHVSKVSLGGLAVGTNWYMGINSNDTHFVLSDYDKYLWDNK